MTAHPTRPPRLLLVVTVVLAVVGIVLLTLPDRTTPPGAAVPEPPSQTAAAGRGTASPAGPAGPAREVSGAGGAGPPRTASPPLPPQGEGPAGDAAVQRALEEAWPADLPAREGRQLLAAGRALLRADATGIGRARWPAVFPAGRSPAPAFGAGSFRIQAAIARRNGDYGRAVVHLVWAAADRGGTFTDGRVTDWHFTRTSAKGASRWTPQPRI
ncbi:hypothetical protein [Streptomyces fructofermentans]|uniref:Uncharacterized protein n=1 Tax=Streptomyces fructofermentans TaxID=152141 RepID=A0A918U5L7_9ACTN|nr:hypothetical protein [Streptomyces fructofermentans]GGX96494.1 hypothetical protein GCM10010515_73790 [Streptomyces fructofermentans]